MVLLAGFPVVSAGLGTAEQIPGEWPPVILYSPPLLTPIETSGTGLAPTVMVRLTVSPRGAVSELEVVSVTPASDYDGLFEEEIRRTVGSWRFAPALRGDVPVARTLEWSLDFRPATTQTWSPLKDASALSSLVRDEAPDHARLLRIFTFPIERQRFYLSALAEKAEKPLDRKSRQQLSEAGVIVVTDHPDPDAARIILNTVHAAVAVTCEVFGDGIPLQAPRLPLLVYVYSSRSQYLDYVRSVDGILESSGIFCPPGLIAIHSEHATRQQLLSVMIHEVVHSVMYRRIVKPGQVLPRWVSEGLADYLGHSRVSRGKLEPGVHRGTQVYRSQASLWRGRSLSQMTLDVVRKRIRHGEALSVDAIVSADRETFYGENMGLYYAQSWMLVHFLRHGDSLWTREFFPRFLLYVAEGYRANVALEGVYGVKPGALEEGYREYARHF